MIFGDGNGGPVSPEILTCIRRALEEDIGPGDVTTNSIVPPEATMHGHIIAKQAGVVAGLDIMAATCLLLDARVSFIARVVEGTRVDKGQELATVTGPARALLTAERTALNFLGRMSGVATLTRQFVDTVAGTKAVILDTRKTAPGLRAIDKLAVQRGGGGNHRIGLYDMILIKDNHIDFAGSLSEAVRRARAANTGLEIEVEARTLDDVRAALKLGVQRVLLDNMTPDTMRRAVELNRGRARLEASGNVTLANVREIAETGVDYISIGALTHSAQVFDASFDWIDRPDKVAVKKQVPGTSGLGQETGPSKVRSHFLTNTKLSLPGRPEGLTTMTADPCVNEMYLKMKAMLGDVVPDFELRYKAELACEINRLKKQRNAVILGHNYMEPALFHSIPDYTGDSLELSRKAARTDADVIVFCGVKFMAETAKILNPVKTVLVPSDKAGCSLAASITATDVRALKQRFPGVPVVTYVNTYADVKAECDICCTSSNAAAVVESLGASTVIFLPDEYLARNVARETGKHIIFPVPGPSSIHAVETGLDYQLIGWRGRCEVHEKFTVDDIERVRQQFPDVVILAHPECSPEVVAAADFSGSTSAMVRYVEQTAAPRYLLLTECAMGDNIAAANPEKNMLRLCSVRCPHMNQITLEDTLVSLQRNQYVIEVPEEIRVRALRAVERMLAIG